MSATKRGAHEGTHGLFSPTLERAVADKVRHGESVKCLALDLGVSAATIRNIARRAARGRGTDEI